MHAEQFNARYTPTSPLSPKLSVSHRPLSPQPNQRKGNHGRQSSRNMHLNIGRFHPTNFHQHDSPAATPSSTVQSPALTLNRVNQPLQLESPRLMREKQREFLERTRLTAKVAASSYSSKPDAPRLDPLGSPKGIMTPLALEEAEDYFTVTGAGLLSPATSPGARSQRGNSPSNPEVTSSKSRSMDIYH